MNIILFEESEVGQPLLPRDPRAMHLRNILRKRTGDRFDAGILGGNRGTGLIDGIAPDGSMFYSLDLRDPPLTRIPVRIAVGFPRPIQLRRLLRDVSNLGVETVDLIGTDLGEKSYRETKLLDDGGARSALIEGAVQAGDTGIPQLAVYPSLRRWLEERPWGDSGWCCAAADNIRPQGSFARLGLQSGIVLAVGSERGWSDRERSLLEQAGFQRLSMGSRPLRTETACIAAVMLAMEKIGALE